MKAIMIAAMFASASPANASPFAVSCFGSSLSEHKLGGPLKRTTDPLPEQIYVIDETAGIVRRALVPRQEFDTVCEFKGKAPDVSIAPGLILVSSAPDFSDDSVECRLELDRKTGKGLHFMRFNLSQDRFTKMTWTMTCKKTSLPEFDSSKNRF